MDSERLARLGMLASALANRALQVAPVEPGEPTWTDGNTVFLDPAAPARTQVQALAVQATLLSAGSLEPDVLRKLKRRPAVARRYLAIEGHRALAANEGWLPPVARGLFDLDAAACSDSPASSLAVARSGREIADTPEVFGTIQARKLLAARRRNEKTAAMHNPRRRGNKVLEELDEDDDSGADATDMFTSPVGGGGALGKLLSKMLRSVRRLGEGGQPGADAPTHRTHSGKRGSGARFSTAPTGALDGPASKDPGINYPEWDIHQRAYRPNWCTVREAPPQVRESPGDDHVNEYGLRRPLARLGLGPDWLRRQVQGDDIDIDAAIEARIEAMAGSAPDEEVYLASLKRRRDLAVLLLLDISGSVAEAGVDGKTVHDLQRASAGALAVALHGIGDRLALYAFHSQGRSAVQMMPIKRFDETLDVFALRQLRGLVPGAYSRLGAAIRHGAAVLEERGGTTRRLLVVISDGLAYDHGYERAYGAADARRALAEARARGTACVCLTVGADTDPEELQRVFGSAAHATLARPEELSRVVGPLFRNALRAAEVRRPQSGRSLSQISVPRYAAPNPA